VGLVDICLDGVFSNDVIVIEEEKESITCFIAEVLVKR
jgi:hypothetical protein